MSGVEAGCTSEEEAGLQPHQGEAGTLEAIRRTAKPRAKQHRFQFRRSGNEDRQSGNIDQRIVAIGRHPSR
jgi:hypothetical protein